MIAPFVFLYHVHAAQIAYENGYYGRAADTPSTTTQVDIGSTLLALMLLSLFAY